MFLNKFYIFLIVLTAVGCSPKHELNSRGDSPVVSQRAKFTPEGLLRKTSFHLQGVKPSMKDYEHFSKINSAEHEDYINEKINEYTNSESHKYKMVIRLQELFQLKLTDPYSQDSFKNFIFDSIKNNVKWDEIFTGKSYRLPSYLFDFYRLTNPEITSQNQEEINIKYDESDSRIAGAITTVNFFNRYINSVTNKNRRRSAAIFKIMLCQDFRTVIEEDLEREGRILDKVFPDKNTPVIGGILPADAHGSDPACFKCHRQLDPMGKTLRSIASKISPFATPGSLVLKVDQSYQEKDVRGLGELVKLVTQSDQYLNCQTQHFWNWFIGNDVPLTRTVHNEIIDKFNELDRKTNDFIKYLVQRPEFGKLEQSPLDKAKSIALNTLKRCDSCHDNSLPRFGEWPIGGTMAKHRVWLQSVKTVLDLKNGGVNKTMPPRNSVWQPTSVEIEALNFWIKEGGEP